jgi:molybdenum cofactor cytidylyltransferase
MIDAIVLAAGRSLRMGTQKLLLPFAGQTVIGHVVDQILAGPTDRTVVVASQDLAAIQPALAGKTINLVENPDPGSEMLDSIRVGLHALSTDTAAALVVLGDQPAIRTALIEQIVHAFQTTNSGIIAPVHAGKRGHPLLVAARYFDKIFTCYDEFGLRGLLAEHAGEILELPSLDDCVLADIDFPEDYQRELRRYADAAQ